MAAFFGNKSEQCFVAFVRLSFWFYKDFLSVDDNCSNCLEMIPSDLSIVS